MDDTTKLLGAGVYADPLCMDTAVLATAIGVFNGAGSTTSHPW